MSNTRLAMLTIPANSRSHFFALYSVVNSLILGLVPLAWGTLLDLSKGLHWQLHGLDFNCYSLFFLMMATLMGASLFQLKHLDESRAMTFAAFSSIPADPKSPPNCGALILLRSLEKHRP